MEPRLSIIIPVYNAEPYLRRCVASCLNQDFDANELEIILCNDGSTDSSLEIAEELATKDSRIKVFSQENAGAGMARNLGLLHAKGTYVMFVDSDDYLRHDTLQSILALSETNNLDLCNYEMEWMSLKTGERKISHTPFNNQMMYDGEKLIQQKTFMLGSVCSCLYRRDFLHSNRLWFSSQSSSEDVVFNLHAYLFAERVMYSDSVVYTYEIREGSRRHSTGLSSRLKYIKNNIKNAAKVMRTTKEMVHLSVDTKLSLFHRSNSMTVGTLLELWHNRQVFTKNNVNDILDFAEKLGIYPIKGRTFSYQTTLLAHLVLNHRSLLLSWFKD